MKPYLFLILLFAACNAFAQRQNVYFFKNNGRSVNVRDSADYIRIVREPDSGSVLYKVNEYYLDGKAKLIGLSSTIDPPRFEGQVASYYANGNRKELIQYSKGSVTGAYYRFFPNGKAYDVRTFPEANIYNGGDFKSEVLITASYDSLGKALVTDGDGYYIGYNADFNEINEEGLLKGGKRDGLWKGGFKKQGLTFTERYQNGVLTEGKSVQNGDTVIYTKQRAIPPDFAGGLRAFYQYVGRNVEYPKDAMQNEIQGQVVLNFVIEKDGAVSDITVGRHVYPSLDAEAIKVLKNSPKWIPGIQYGRKVRVKYTVPITFRLQ